MDSLGIFREKMDEIREKKSHDALRFAASRIHVTALLASTSGDDPASLTPLSAKKIGPLCGGGGYCTLHHRPLKTGFLS